MVTRPLHRQLIALAMGTALALMVPWTASRFTSEVNWGAADYAMAAMLLFGAGSVILLVARRVASRAGRATAVAAVVLALALVWAELAVGLFD